jgi:hypothetical protein
MYLHYLDELLTNLPEQTNKKKNVIGSKCLYASIGVCMFSLIAAVSFIMETKIKPNGQGESINKRLYTKIFFQIIFDCAKKNKSIIIYPVT